MQNRMTKHAIFSPALLLSIMSLAVAAPGDWLVPKALAASTAAPAAEHPDLGLVFGAEDAFSWEPASGTAKYTTAHDPSLGMTTLTVTDSSPLVLQGKVHYTGNREIRAWVRFHGGQGPIIFTVAQRPSTATLGGRQGESNLGMKITGSDSQPDGVTATAFRDGVDNPLNIEPSRADLGFTPPIFNDYTCHGRDKWLAVRIEMRQGLVRFWLDDHIVAWRHDPTISPDGTMTMKIGPGAQLADFHTTSPVAQAGFLPLRLSGYANGREFLGSEVAGTRQASLANSLIHVGSVPFVWPAPNPEGKDHLQVDGTLRDPAGGRLRIPNAPYDALYVLAAADGQPDQAPLLSATFCRPDTGGSVGFAVHVPSAGGANSATASPLPVALEDGRPVKLWMVKVPLDPGQLSVLADLDVVELQLAQTASPSRSTPATGPASAVHIYGLTLARTPIDFDWQPTTFGDIWQSPNPISYTATMVNHTPSIQTGMLTVSTRSYDGKETTEWEKPLTLDQAKSSWPQPVTIHVPLQVKRFGYHEVTATLQMGGRTWVETRGVVLLAPGEPTPRGTPLCGAMLDYLSFGGVAQADRPSLQRSIPYCDPTPAFAASATMADQIGTASFDGWVKTGVASTYCLRFRKADDRGYVYALWSADGPRPVKLTLDRDSSFFSSAAILATDAMDNTRKIPVHHKQATLMADASVVYVTFPKGKGRVVGVEVEEANLSGGKPAGVHEEASVNVGHAFPEKR